MENAPECERVQVLQTSWFHKIQNRAMTDKWQLLQPRLLTDKEAPKWNDESRSKYDNRSQCLLACYMDV